MSIAASAPVSVPVPSATSAPAAPAESLSRPHRRRSRRWIRAVAPFVVLLALWTVTGIAHAVEEPDLGDPDTLSPIGTGRDGSSQLAAMLRERGVGIDRVDTWQRAAEKVSGDTTVFVPMPDFIFGDIVTEVANRPGRHRLVMVEPGAHLPFSDRRWATGAVRPDCDDELANRAGRAAVHRSRYDAGALSLFNCYRGGLVSVREGGTEIVVVGATDPFRNSRIGEVGNAILAVGLLAEYRHVVWVDDHEPDPIRAQLRLRWPGYDRPELDRGRGDSTFDAFPAALWATLALAFAAAVLFAVVRARRLGPPVAEPLPVLVPSAEAVTGRGRLYHRVGARQATLDALRTAAIVRLTRVLNPYGGAAAERELTGRGDTTPAAEDLIARVAARTGAQAHSVRAILYGPPPANDDQLSQAIAQVDALVVAVLRDTGRTSRPTPEPPSPQPHRGGTP
jgi:hypothetical protein